MVALLAFSAVLEPVSPPVAAPAVSFVAVSMQGSRIGYTRTETLTQADRTTTRSLSVIETGMLGTPLKMRIESETVRRAGRLTSLRFQQESSGRTLLVTAEFLPREIRAVSRSGGDAFTQTIPVPAGVVVTDDPAGSLQGSATRANGSQTVHVFDPATLALLPVKIDRLGMKPVTVKGTERQAEAFRIEDPRAPLTLYLDAKGDMVKADGPLGMEMIPATEAEALAWDRRGGTAGLAEASSIRPQGPFSGRAPRAVLEFRGVDLTRLPSDANQQSVKTATGWKVTLSPVDPRAEEGRLKRGTVAGMERWTRPELRVSSDDPAIRRLAQSIVGSEQDVIRSAEKLRRHVYDSLGVNAGIGVLRDATEILKTREGVCRDHAILLAALNRSVGIPTRLVSGLVYQGGAFYYHAWVEVWSGRTWVPFDSTRPAPRLTTGHVRIRAGSVEDAYTSFLLDGARIHVIES
ncbi:MAG: transglutaminase-like domain-containing protein [Fimbriimonadaceae bacterium]|nr:transglutaminase-like domain-containing protein [Fimbriimonadaceae bacterium]